LEAYWTVCERALSQFEGTADPAVAEQIAKDCLILPPPAGSLERLAKMADIAVAAGPANPSWPSYMFVKGLAEYRQGHFAGALEWMRKVAAQEGVPARTAQAYATMALAEYQLGQTNAARTALAQGLKIPESELANPGRLDWNDAIIAHSLLREAQRLIMRPPNPGETAK
jgi:tetratricopeptide (TPR) repeat protein